MTSGAGHEPGADRGGRDARYRLGPLAVPGIGPNEPGHCAAVELFADRASRVDPGFALDGTTGPVIGQVVARLDGMPLAIELAAARVEALGLGQLLDASMTGSRSTGSLALHHATRARDG